MSTKERLLEDAEDLTELLENNGLTVMTINGLHISEKDGDKYSLISFSVEQKVSSGNPGGLTSAKYTTIFEPKTTSSIWAEDMIIIIDPKMGIHRIWTENKICHNVVPCKTVRAKYLKIIFDVILSVHFGSPLSILFRRVTINPQVAYFSNLDQNYIRITDTQQLRILLRTAAR